MIGNSRRIPRFIKAPTEEELEKAIFKMQMRLQMEFKFINIYRSKNEVVAWFYMEADAKDILGEISNGIA